MVCRLARVLPVAGVIVVFGCAPAAFDVVMPPPDPGLWGDGRDGDEVFVFPTAINVCHPLVSGSASSLTLTAGTSLAPGVSILVWQVQDDVTVVSSAMQISVGNAGRSEVVRVASTNGSVLAVEPALGAFYSSVGGARRAQVCTVPEYESVIVQPGASLLATEWNGSTGGFLGFFARGTVTLEGTLDATGDGFRGALPLGNGGGSNETSLTNVADKAGAIGEGIDGSLFGMCGRGNAANGGGGGGAFNSGGGGGSNEGAGGRGASQVSTPNPGTFGHGGAALTATGRLLLGGGGGSGHQNDNLAGGGGDGGGVIFVKAFRMTGSGDVDASGFPGEASRILSSLADGAGGGGAGGTIVLESSDWGFTGAVVGRGGEGGSVDRSGLRGLGGGGGGGRAVLPSRAVTVPVLTGGIAGVNADGSHLDATAGAPDPGGQ